MKIGSSIKAPFFEDMGYAQIKTLDSLDLKAFGWIEYSKSAPPIWHQSITSKKIASVQELHWSEISDFYLDIGDIKSVWELSRFDWLFEFVVEFLKTGNPVYLAKINLWIEDWSKHNPVNMGINWKCGQEASIRVLHLCLTSLLLKQHENLSPSIILMLEQHLTRISPTVIYAMAQDNNHGTSEAAALYIGGLVLERNNSNTQATKWRKQGLFWLENRVKRLISEDGSFSQHSVNYHRVMLDTLCLAELFRRDLSQPEFSEASISKLQKATNWLRFFTDELTGDAPNLGANDGARLMPLTDTDNSDYRPTVQLASVLFFGKKSYRQDGKYNQLLELLELDSEQYLDCKKNIFHFDEGGYLFSEKSRVRLFMRYPKFKFRPSQCDVFHIDLFLDGVNILRDAGSYSYNTELQWLDYFPSTAAHNTVQFDGTEQMPRLSRFLYGDWLTTNNHLNVTQLRDEVEFCVEYCSASNIQHKRAIILSSEQLTVTDSVSGFTNKAVLRWRLPPGNLYIEDNLITTEHLKITINSDVELKRLEIVDGWESRYYMRKSKLSVLEVEVAEPAKIISKLTWAHG
jgi:hypothetical protein